jgi:hypothetical protein
VFSVTITRTNLDETAFEMTIHKNSMQQWLNTKPKTFNFDVVSERVEHCTKIKCRSNKNLKVLTPSTETVQSKLWEEAYVHELLTP